MLKVSNLYLAYAKDYNVLNNINFDLPVNKQMIILGDKDSGKTSLVRVLAGLERINKGEIFIKGFNLKEIKYNKNVNLAFLPSNPILFENKTVLANLEYVLKIRKLNKTAIDVKVNNALYNYGFSHLKNTKVKELSSFEKIKLSFARFSERDVDLFLIDNIFNGFSEAEVKELVQLIKSLIKSQENCSAIIFTDSNNILNMFSGLKYKLEYGTLEKIV